MDERMRISLWMVSGGGLGVVLGGVFGGLTGAFYCQSGRSAGTRFGRKVADAFVRAAEREPSRIRQGAITGAADGVLFLGILGTVGGALMGISGRATVELLGQAAAGSLVLVGGAVFFGALAYALTRNGIRTIGGVLAGCLAGAIVAGFLLGADRCLLGVVPGLVAGLLSSLVTRRYAPEFRPPRLGKVIPHLRSDAETDIMGPPHPRSDNDSFQKPDPFDDE